MVLICLCLLVYDCSEVRQEVRPDGWISVVSVFSLPSFPKLLLFCFLPSFLWIMKMISILQGAGRISAPSGCSIGSYLCTTGYEKYHYGNHYFLYSAVYSRTELQDHRRCDSDRGSPFDHIFVHCCTAGSDPDQGLSENAYYVLYLYPENEEYQEDIEQQNNSKTAIASGELVGKKLTGDDQVSSVNAGNFVAENQTDFIFAVAGEEYGFIGCTTLVVLLLLISVECIRMSLGPRIWPGRLSAAELAVW